MTATATPSPLCPLVTGQLKQTQFTIISSKERERQAQELEIKRNKALAKWVVTSAIPMNTVDDKHARELFSLCGYSHPGRFKITGVIDALFDEAVEKVFILRYRSFLAF